MGPPHRVGLVPPKKFCSPSQRNSIVDDPKKNFPDEIVFLLKRPFVLFLITARKNKRVSHITHTHTHIAQKLKKKKQSSSSLIGPLSLFFSLHFFFLLPI
jgi:hypothetical protein